MFTRWRKSRKTEPPPSPLAVDAGLLTDMGCRREINEDGGRHIHPVEGERLNRKGVLTLVADGMGGHAAGEVASRLAVEVISRVYYESSDEPARALKLAFREANRAIYNAAHGDENLKGMGTTGTALVLHQGMGYCAHIGDSRLYMIRGAGIYRMSEDHTMVMDMVKRGLLRPAEASRHADRNVLVRALGAAPNVEISTWEKPFPVREGDRFILCSDGLYDLVSDEEIKAATLEMDPPAACRNLIDQAKARGGHDNITVAIIALRTPVIGDPEGLRATRIAPAME